MRDIAKALCHAQAILLRAEVGAAEGTAAVDFSTIAREARGIFEALGSEPMSRPDHVNAALGRAAAAPCEHEGLRAILYGGDVRRAGRIEWCTVCGALRWEEHAGGEWRWRAWQSPAQAEVRLPHGGTP